MGSRAGYLFPHHPTPRYALFATIQRLTAFQTTVKPQRITQTGRFARSQLIPVLVD